jgi:hypothetical protein
MWENAPAEDKQAILAKAKLRSELQALLNECARQLVEFEPIEWLDQENLRGYCRVCGADVTYRKPFHTASCAWANMKYATEALDGKRP